MWFPLILTLFISVAISASAREIRVAQQAPADFVGHEEKAIQAAVKQAVAEGGGTVLIGPGEYLVRQPITLTGARRVTLRGEPGAVLKFAPLAYGELASDAAAGAVILPLRRSQGFRSGQDLRIMAPGGIHPFTGKPTLHFNARTASVEGQTVTFEKPLAFPVPAGTAVVWDKEPNMIEVRGMAEEIAIESLTLNGAGGPETPQVATHHVRCGVWVEGKYDYEKGPVGPKPRQVTVRDCRVVGFHGRGIAFYSVEEGVVERSRIEQTLEEAIDFDHFSVRCVARENDLSGCRIGVEINDANDCLVERNRIVGPGVRIWRWCKLPELNLRNRITENRFEPNGAMAIEFREGTAENVATANVVVARANRTLNDLIRDRGERNRIEGNDLRPQ